MTKRPIEFPSRPRVAIGRRVYEEIAPEQLDRVLGELRAWIYSHKRALTPEERHRAYARLVAAAAVNALLEE